MATTGYWVICLQGYEIDGIDIKKGQMDYYTSSRPIINPDWRKATDTEVEKKDFYKGNWYLPIPYWTF